MASVNEILLPRRAKKSVMKSPTKKVIVLEEGEIFMECSDDGIGRGHVIFKVGDGETQYQDLPYACGDTSNDEIEFDGSTETNIDVVIGKISTGSKLKELITNIKRAISILKGNDDVTNETFDKLTDGRKIVDVKLVDALPEDAASHPTTLYFIKA